MTPTALELEYDLMSGATYKARKWLATNVDCDTNIRVRNLIEYRQDIEVLAPFIDIISGAIDDQWVAAR